MQTKIVKYGLHETTELNGFGKVQIDVVGTTTKSKTDKKLQPVCRIYGDDLPDGYSNGFPMVAIDWDNGEVFRKYK